MAGVVMEPLGWPGGNIRVGVMLCWVNPLRPIQLLFVPPSYTRAVANSLQTTSYHPKPIHDSERSSISPTSPNAIRYLPPNQEHVRSPFSFRSLSNPGFRVENANPESPSLPSTLFPTPPTSTPFTTICPLRDFGGDGERKKESGGFGRSGCRVSPRSRV